MEIDNQILDMVGSSTMDRCKNKDANTGDQEIGSCYATLLVGLHSALILVLCILFSSPLLLLPQQNSIIFPEFWYEAFVITLFGFFITLTLDAMLICRYYLKIESMISTRTRCSGFSSDFTSSSGSTCVY